MGAAATAVGVCVAMALVPGLCHAKPAPCPGAPPILVAAPFPDDAAAVCATVARASPRLAACGLEQSRLLTIRVVREITHPVAGCMAQYDCRDDSIAVTAPDALPGILMPDSLWRRIPTGALFASLVVHELAHAFLDRTDCPATPCLADHGYTAFALQIDALNAADRAAILKGSGLADPGETGRLHAFTARVNPGCFAQAAWLHFSQPGNGCAFAGELVAGTRTLWVDPDLPGRAASQSLVSTTSNSRSEAPRACSSAAW